MSSQPTSTPTSLGTPSKAQALLAWTRYLLPYLLAVLGAIVVVVRPECAPFVDEVHRRMPVVVPMDPVTLPPSPQAPMTPCDPDFPGHEHRVLPAPPLERPAPEGEGVLLELPAPSGVERALAMRLRASWAPPGRARAAPAASSVLSDPSTRSQGLSGAADVPPAPLGSPSFHSTPAALRRHTRS